jgi:hypothetical protein
MSGLKPEDRSKKCRVHQGAEDGGGQSATLWLFDEPTDSLVLRLVVDSMSPIGIDPEHHAISPLQMARSLNFLQIFSF